MEKNRFNRYTALMLIIIVTFTVIIGRLFTIQIVHGEEFINKAHASTRGRFVTLAPRGNILDRNGVELAINQQSYALVYNDTRESRENFYTTMEKVFEILDSNSEKQNDSFPIIIDPENPNKLIFDFRERDEDTRRWLELRFKKDRGFDDSIRRKLFGSRTNLSDYENQMINEELLKLTAEEVFDSLFTTFRMHQSSIADVSLAEKRRYLIVRDALRIVNLSNRNRITLASNIKRETAFIFYQTMNDLTGIDVTIEPIRHYPHGEVASAVLGYISKVPSWQKDRYEERGYDVTTDYIGMSGIESAFESRLKGSKGEQVAIVNNSGRIISELGRIEPYPGQNIHLTIDKNIQAVAEKALDETMKTLQQRGRFRDVDSTNATRGAAVAVDVNTGAILAMASRPGFNPNFFASPEGLSTEIYRQYFNLNTEEVALSMGYTPEQIDRFFPLDKRIQGNTTIREDMYDILPKPLFNYATMSVIPPGSTYKMVTAIAGLETGVITPSTVIHDAGYFDDGNNFRTTFAGGSNGIVNLAKALEVSSNPFFMMIGKQLRGKYGDDILATYSRKLGLGINAPSGIELSERYGQVFSTKLLQEVFSQQYLWSTMAMLRDGADSRGNKFIPLDLYDRESDSTELRTIKREFKSQIQNSIVNRAFSSNLYRDLINRLIAADPQYKGQNFTNQIITSTITAINGITIHDGNNQLRVGANMYNASIGQGVNAFTPLEMANYISILANGGNRYKLHLVDKITDPEGNIVQQTKPEILETADLKPQTLEAVKHGMYLVNNGASGTATNAFRGFPIISGGKTGSATFSNVQESFGRTSFGWYVGFAPFDKPQIAVSVVIFDGGHGGAVAPVARAIFEEYFREELQKTHPDYIPLFSTH